MPRFQRPITEQMLRTEVPGRGPCPALMMIVGEGPGVDEVNHRDWDTRQPLPTPFVGRSGKEVDRHLDNNGLSRDRCFVTNVTRFIKLTDDINASDVARDSPKLQEEIARVQPKYILALGRHAVRWFLGDVDVDTVHGIPHRTSRCNAVVLPGYHPAAGFYSPEVQGLIAHDFRRFGQLVRRQIEDKPVVDEHPDPQYMELTDSPVVRYMPPRRPEFVAIDTEGTPGYEWGLSFSAEPGQAFVIHKSSRDRVRDLLMMLEIEAPTVIMHNSMYDLEMLRGLGIDLLKMGLTIVDTMVMAYNLCTEPQGLKPLAYRHCGMQLGSYDELIQEAEEQSAWSFLEELLGKGKLPKPEVRLILEGVDWKAYQPNSPSTWASKLFTDLTTGKLKKNGEPYTYADIRPRWKNLDIESRKIAEQALGRSMPVITLDDVHPRGRVIKYAGGDADATLRLYPKLRRLLEAA